MKRNLLKTMAIILIAVLAISAVAAISNNVSAMGLNDAQDVKRFKDNATDSTNTSNLISKWLGAALVVVQVVGVGVAVIMLVVLAIKYISAAPSDKAEIKKHAVVYVVGAIVLFAASGILGLIRKFATNANEALGE